MLKLRQLTQRYGARVALNALSVSIARGSFVVLLGPNGAGKSRACRSARSPRV
ncbi:hypothetical protein [Piscinibacter sp.]|jgi:ABC-2 type transport system ATP-binding protein|uniref:hypothetical protein n=1 Tax=Piscinibacter sp. TaxID=1903157 RepID=UPI002F3F206A